MKLLLVGSTGLVGREVLKLALTDARISEVVVLARRALSVEHAKLRTVVVDFDDLPEEASVWQADGVICTLGTTMKQAGSKAAFKRVDYDYPLLIAQKAHEHGTPTYVVNSAAMANADSRIFYNKVKGELERDLNKVGFTSLSIVRPGLIDGERAEFRLGEHVFGCLLRFFAPLLPRRFRVNPATRIAQALMDAAIAQPKGVSIVPSELLT